MQATGTYDPAGQVLIRNRSFDSAPGYHVVTPLRLADGSALLVNRGWIPISTEVGKPPDIPAPPTGTVTVEGRVRGTQERGAFGPTDPSDGVLTELARVDVARLRQQLTYPVLPAYVELTAQEPAPSPAAPPPHPAPRARRRPPLRRTRSSGSSSPCCAVVGWVLVVRRQLKQDERDAAKAAAA